jgi:hypothetical protein
MALSNVSGPIIVEAILRCSASQIMRNRFSVVSNDTAIGYNRLIAVETIALRRFGKEY